MTPRIETAEILSFRLKVPPEEVELLAQHLGPALGLALEEEDGELLLAVTDGDSYLRFRPIGADAMLTEVFLCNDVRGQFFQQVLGGLMVRFHGDLHIRLVWNTPERNSHGDFADVRITRGSTTYPGLSNVMMDLPPAASVGGEQQLEAAAGREASGPSMDGEVEALLAKARAHWEEYQRLKRSKR